MPLALQGLLCMAMLAEASASGGSLKQSCPQTSPGSWSVSRSAR